MPARTRLTAALSCALALCLLGSSPASARLLLGIGDEQPAVFSNPFYKALKVKRVRLITSYDVALHSPGYLNAYMGAARAAHQEIIVAFDPSAGSKCPAKPCSLPSSSRYAQAIKAFRKAYPFVRIFQPWNENNNYTEPTYRNPQAVVTYYKIVQQQCRGCTVLGGDIEDLATGPGTPESKYIKELLVAYRKAHVKIPQIWGVHNYVDANYFKTIGTSTALKLLPGQIWLTETGGIASFTTAGGHVNLHYNLRRQAKATDFLLKLALKNRRVARIYIYDLLANARNRFDSSLLGVNGAPRPAYFTLRNHYGKYFS